MTALTHAALRSTLRPERPTPCSRHDRRRHDSPWSPAFRLVGHLAATTFVFVSFVTLVWLASWNFSYLHSAHPFSDDAFHLFEALEGALIRIDAALSGAVLLRGLGLYVLNIVRGQS